VRVAATDLTDDGRAEIITGPGPGTTAQIKVLDATTLTAIQTFSAYAASWPNGVFVAGPTPLYRMSVDIAAPSTTTPRAATIAGWALSEGAPANTIGVTAVNVWAYPAAGGAPVFAGATTIGGRRADVAQAYGGQFQDSGFRFDTTPLAPGSYYLVVYIFTGTRVVEQRIVTVTIQ